MSADVCKGTRRTEKNQSLNSAGLRGWRIKDIDMGQRRAAAPNRHHMLTRVARIEMDRVMVLILMRGSLMMLVRSRAVAVLGMIVTGIRVGVQRGHVGGSANEGEADHDGDEALH